MIALLVIATGDYMKYAENLILSARKHFLNGKFDVYLFTDKKPIFDRVYSVFDDVYHIYTEHKPWPYPTLMRYHIILGQKKILSQYDYVYYCDADMLFVDGVGEEILGDIVVTSHPGFYNKSRKQFSYEKCQYSTAHIRYNQGEVYVAGGFNGGSEYLDMALQIKTMVDIDSLNGIVPEWHDESYLNKYVFMYGYDILLSPSYCFPDRERDVISWGLKDFKPKLLALTK